MIRLPDYPWFPNDVMEPDEPLLDRLMRDEPTDLQRFFFGRLQLRIFADMLTGDPPSLPRRSALWLMHVSGYFGGVWLRQEIAQALPDAALLGVELVPDADAFAQLTDALVAATSAADGDDAAAIAFAQGQIEPRMQSYGYNHGYLLEILATPPAGLVAPAGFLVAPGLLDARYAVDDVTGLGALRDRFERAATAGRVDVASLTADQTEADATGRSVWSTGLSVQGFSQAAYEQLLELSAYFLQGAQATAIAAVLACAEADGELARRAALLSAVMDPPIISYRMGLFDGRADRALPALV
jgi:hypothetical protein